MRDHTESSPIGSRRPACFVYNSSISALNKTDYAVKLLSDNQIMGKNSFNKQFHLKIHYEKASIKAQSIKQPKRVANSTHYSHQITEIIHWATILIRKVK
jgi:hypothetical protein